MIFKQISESSSFTCTCAPFPTGNHEVNGVHHIPSQWSTRGFSVFCRSFSRGGTSRNFSLFPLVGNMFIDVVIVPVLSM